MRSNLLVHDTSRFFGMSLSNALVRLSTLLLLLCAVGVQAQLNGRVGPTTSLDSKQRRICNVLDYGGSIGSNVRMVIIASIDPRWLTWTSLAGHRTCHWQSVQ